MASSSSSAAPLLDSSTSAPPLLMAENWCKTHIKVETFNCTWTIENFSCCEMEVGENLESSTFRFAKRVQCSPKLKQSSADPNDERRPKWRLRLFPSGNKEACSEYVSLYLLLEKHPTATRVSAKYTLAILNAKNEKINTKSGTHKFVPDVDWGWSKIIRRNTLMDEQNELLPDDRLSIYCEVSMVVDTTRVSRHSTANQCSVPKFRLSEDFGALLEKSSFSDCVLCSDGTEFKAHKVVLACRSPVFAAMFEHKTTEESLTNRVNIQDISAPVLGQLLHFVYTGCEPKLLAEQDMAQGLLAAADKYQLDRLKAICESELCLQLNKDNVCDVLALAERHNAEQLKAKAIEYISVRAEEAMSLQQTPPAPNAASDEQPAQQKKRQGKGQRYALRNFIIR